jgi:hypothetical protein
MCRNTAGKNYGKYAEKFHQAVADAVATKAE